MKLLDLSFPDPGENLACDEALLDLCEEDRMGPLLRFWEPANYFVVLGYANATATEVNRDYCERHGIPILRRCTGGGTVLQGPGCLNYSLVLEIQPDGPLQGIRSTNEFVMGRHRLVLQRLLQAPVHQAGDTDLAIGGLKFSGNAQRRRKRFLLFHGCFLLQLDLEKLEQVLPMPSRWPEYRLNRSHTDFLMNLRLRPEVLKTALQAAWGAAGSPPETPFARISTLAREKYALDEWNLKF